MAASSLEGGFAPIAVLCRLRQERLSAWDGQRRSRDPGTPARGPGPWPEPETPCPKSTSGAARALRPGAPWLVGPRLPYPAVAFRARIDLSPPVSRARLSLQIQLAV